MKYETAIQLKEGNFPQRIFTYGTCPHVENNEIEPGQCGCDIMYKIVGNPNLNELVDACCPEFESMSFAPGKTIKENVWVVAGKIGRTKRIFHASYADQALAEFWLVKHRYQLKQKNNETKPAQAPASIDSQSA